MRPLLSSDAADVADAGWLARQLPEHVVDDPFLRRFVGIFEEVADSVRVHADALPHLADLDVTPEPMLRWLGRWFALSVVDESVDVARQREMVAGVGAALAWRGTARGLADLLAAVTGGEVTVWDSGGIFVEGEAPGGGRFVWIEIDEVDGWVAEHLVELVRREVPADAGFELAIAGHVVATEGVAPGGDPVDDPADDRGGRDGHDDGAP